MPTTVLVVEEEKSFVCHLVPTISTILRQVMHPFFSVLHGGEYDTVGGPHNDLGNHNVACAVCLASTRAAMTMVPAQLSVPLLGLESTIYGYLMAERENGVEFVQSSYACVDVSQS